MELNELTPEQRKQLISEHMKELGHKSSEVIKKKYGNEHYKKMIKARWDKRINKTN